MMKAGYLTIMFYGRFETDDGLHLVDTPTDIGYSWRESDVHYANHSIR